MDVVHVRIGRRVIGQDDGFGKRRHVSQREAVPQIRRKKGVGREKAVFEKERMKGVCVVRVYDTVENRGMVNGSGWEG